MSSWISAQLRDPEVSPLMSAFSMFNEQQKKDEQDNKEFMGLCQDILFNNRNSHILRCLWLVPQLEEEIKTAAVV